MKKTIIFMLLACVFISCKQQSVYDKAALEAQQFTEKNCPTPIIDNTRTDSITFDYASKTLCYHNSLFDAADNADNITANKENIHQHLLNNIINATNIKTYKEASINFRYVYRSGANPDVLLYDVTFTKKEYGN